MRAWVVDRGARRTDEHPPLPPDAGLALAVEVGPEGDLMAHVTYLVDDEVQGSYRRIDAVLAFTVESPAHGACDATLVDETTELVESPLGPHWRGGARRKADPDAPLHGGWVTATLRLEPSPPRPATLFVRAALRDLVSPAVAVELR